MNSSDKFKRAERNFNAFLCSAVQCKRAVQCSANVRVNIKSEKIQMATFTFCLCCEFERRAFFSLSEFASIVNSHITTTTLVKEANFSFFEANFEAKEKNESAFECAINPAPLIASCAQRVESSQQSRARE